MAEIINSVGEREGRRFAEHLTFKERGIERVPQKPEGEEAQDKIARGDELTNAAEGRIDRNQDIITANIAAEGGTRMQQLRKLPKRWKAPKFFDSWWSKLGGLIKRHEAKEEVERSPANIQKTPNRIRRNLPIILSSLGPDKAQPTLSEELYSCESKRARSVVTAKMR